MSLALAGLDQVVGLGRDLLVRLFPDPAQRAAAELELEKLAASGELARLQAVQQLADMQAKVNAQEAAHASLFVAGWRPFVGWMAGVGFAYEVLARPLLTWAAIAAGWTLPPGLDAPALDALLWGLLGLGGFRTAESIGGVARRRLGLGGKP